MRSIARILTVALLVVSCTPPKTVPPEVNGVFTPQTTHGGIPAWVQQLNDDSLPPDLWVQAVVVASTSIPPPVSAALEELNARLHEEVVASLKGKLGPTLLESSRVGRWVDQSMLPPTENWQTREFSDGVTSARLIAIKRRDLINRNKEQALAPLRLGRSPAVPEVGSESALEFVRRSVTELRAALTDLAAMTIASADDATPGPSDLHLHECEALALRLKDVRSWFRVEMTGGNRRLTLGTRPEEGFQMRLTYMGQPAEGLPLRPMGDGLPLDGDFETSALGAAALRFTGQVVYTGRDAAYPGFALNPDLLLPAGRTGIVIDPWQARVELPAADNVVIYLNFVEKQKNYTLEDGPFRKALLRLLRSSGLAITTESPHRFEDQTYVLEVSGIINTWELRSSGAGMPTKVTAEGSLQLRHRGGATIASRAVQGFAEVRPGNEDADHQLALQNAFDVNRAAVARAFRAAFPPIMPPSVENE